MLVNITIKQEKNADNNIIGISKNKVSMKEARDIIKAYDKKGILKMGTRWFDGWHYQYKTIWVKNGNRSSKG